MPFAKRSSVAARTVAFKTVASLLVLIPLSMEAAAKSRHAQATSHASAVNRARQSPATYLPRNSMGAIGFAPYSGPMDCCAGWGHVGAP